MKKGNNKVMTVRIKMMKAICFGAAGGGKRLYNEVSSQYQIIAYTDNDSKKWGDSIQEIPVLPPMEAIRMSYDVIVITSAPGLENIKKQLIELNIPENKIITSFITFPLEARKVFLEKLSSIQSGFSPDAEVAEAGVFEGDFARLINKYYPSRILHLFDTFSGFDNRDISKETQFSSAVAGDYSNTSVELVMGKMFYPEKVVIHQGYFPDTAKDIKSTFCFVNLDMDLYEPTYQGLKFFENKMVDGGVILVHDYFAENFKGPRNAVDRFIEESNGRYNKYPIGDGISMMVVGF